MTSPCSVKLRLGLKLGGVGDAAVDDDEISCEGLGLHDIIEPARPCVAASQKDPR
jgi:hypothetical protein